MSEVAEKVSPEEIRQGTQVYGSPLTMQKYASIRDQMAELAGKPIVIVNREELAVFKSGKSHPTWVLDEVQNAELLVDWNKSGQRLKDFFQKSVDPEVAQNLMGRYAVNPGRIQESDYEAVAKGIILSRGPFAEHDFRKGDKDVGLIRAPDHSATAQDHISHLTGIPAHFIKNFPGAAGDYEAIVMLHEAKHISQSFRPGFEILPFEADADHSGISTYLASVERGTDLNKDVPKFLAEIREAASIGGVGSELHGLMKDLPGTYLGLPGVGSMVKESSLPTHSTHAFLGEDGFDMMKFSAMRRVGMVVNMIVGQAEVSNKLKDIRKEMETPNAALSISDTKFLQEHGGVSNIFKSHDLGALKIGEDPAKGYDTIKALHQSKFFKAGSEEAKYIERINNFLEKYAPDYISEPERLATRKELVDNLDKIKGMVDIPTVNDSLDKTGKSVHPQAVPDFTMAFTR